MSVFIMKRDENGSYKEVKTPKLTRRADAMRYLKDNIDRPEMGMGSTDEFMVVGNPTKVRANKVTKITLTADKTSKTK
jgi:hypothetical protein